MIRGLWLVLGLSALCLGIIGIVLPFFPTVPFVLLAAFAFAKSSPAWHRWLLKHPIFGEMIMDWQSGGRIRKPAKWVATLTVVVSFAISLLLAMPPIVLLVQGAIMLGVLTFIWTRPH